MQEGGGSAFQTALVSLLQRQHPTTTGAAAAPAAADAPRATLRAVSAALNRSPHALRSIVAHGSAAAVEAEIASFGQAITQLEGLAAGIAGNGSGGNSEAAETGAAATGGAGRSDRAELAQAELTQQLLVRALPAGRANW